MGAIGGLGRTPISTYVERLRSDVMGRGERLGVGRALSGGAKGGFDYADRLSPYYGVDALARNVVDADRKTKDADEIDPHRNANDRAIFRSAQSCNSTFHIF